jgi:O-antigen/teichoic acid export membrane protein
MGGVFSGINLLYATVITASGRTKVNSINTIIGCLISIVTNFVLVPWIGITGAAIAFTLAFAIIFVLSMTYSKFSLISINEFIICIIWGICIYLFVYYFNFSPGLYSIVIKIIAVCMFAILAFKFLGVKMNKTQGFNLVK